MIGSGDSVGVDTKGNGELPEPVLLSVNNVRLGVQIEDF